MTDLYSGHGWRLTMERAVLPDGRAKEDVRVHRVDSVHIIAEKDDGKILLLREYRPFWGDYVYMLPSGKMDKETDRLIAAQRELQEETGYRADEMTYLYSVNMSEAINITHHIFSAKGLHHDPLPQDADELIEVLECAPEDALQKIETSSHVHATSAYALRRWMSSRNAI